MNPKERAKYLFDIFEPLVFNPEDTEAVCDSKAKECALICVSEMKKEVDSFGYEYFNNVEIEINKL